MNIKTKFTKLLAKHNLRLDVEIIEIINIIKEKNFKRPLEKDEMFPFNLLIDDGEYQEFILLLESPQFMNSSDAEKILKKIESFLDNGACFYLPKEMYDWEEFSEDFHRFFCKWLASSNDPYNLLTDIGYELIKKMALVSGDKGVALQLQEKLDTMMNIKFSDLNISKYDREVLWKDNLEQD